MVAEYVPALQPVHEVLPDTVAYFPSTHWLHIVAEEILEEVPVGQETHCCAVELRCQYFPGSHARHEVLEDALTEGKIVPI